jgi:hypothetical protein
MRAESRKQKQRSQMRAVVLITVHEPTITPLEEISLRQCFKVLGSHPIRLICPSGMDVSAYKAIIPEIVVDYIAPHWQSSYTNFAKLKIEPFLYERYQAYEYVLFYELDVFVFRDELEKWCAAGLDYIGAPWFVGHVVANDSSPVLGVGNGGFSLRKTASMLRARRSTWLWLRLLASHVRSHPLQALGRVPEDLLRILRGKYPSLVFARGEDNFWGLVVNRHLRWFRVASFDEAREFSFEALPRRLYKLNGDRLPFGCHAWTRYDIDFFRPHVEAFGYDLARLAPRANFHTLEKVN